MENATEKRTKNRYQKIRRIILINHFKCCKTNLIMKTKSFNFKMLLLIALLFVGFEGIAQKIHMIIVNQTNKAQNIGSNTDKANMEKFATTLETYAGVDVNVTNIRGADATKSKITSTLQSLSIGSNDVVWYYYTGHGLNYDTWPESDEGEVPLMWVHQQLMATSARLTIAAYDACNWQEAIASPPSGYSAKSFMLKFLFLESKGDIIIASTSSEMFSYGKTGVGGIFTNSLLDALMDNSSWKKVLESATQRTKQVAQQSGKTQEPKYELKNMEEPEHTDIIPAPGDFKIRRAYASLDELAKAIESSIEKGESNLKITLTGNDVLRWNPKMTEENWKTFNKVYWDLEN